MLAGDPAQAAVRFNIARCLEELKRPADAIAAYELYLRTPEPGGRSERARAALAALRGEAPGRLAVRCEPDDATISVSATTGAQASGDTGPTGARAPDGRAIGAAKCPLDAPVAAGRYTVRASKAGYAERVVELTVASGERREVVVSLRPESGPAPPAGAALSTAATPAAPPGPGPWPWVVAGTGGLLLVGGGVLHAMAAGARDDAAGAPPGRGREDDLDRFHTLRGATVGAYAAGAAVAALGVWLLLRPSDQTASGFLPFADQTASDVEVRF